MCGIWGIVNTRPRKFDYTTFCTLGIANDTRGGDSCGYSDKNQHIYKIPYVWKNLCIANYNFFYMKNRWNDL